MDATKTLTGDTKKMSGDDDVQMTPITTCSSTVAHWPNGSSYPCGMMSFEHLKLSTSSTKCQCWQGHGTWGWAVNTVWGIIMVRKLLQLTLKTSDHLCWEEETSLSRGGVRCHSITPLRIMIRPTDILPSSDVKTKTLKEDSHLFAWLFFSCQSRECDLQAVSYVKTNHILLSQQQWETTHMPKVC